jgi:hypothetical protein
MSYFPTTVALENSLTSDASRYQIMILANGSTSSGQNLLGLRKLSSSPVVRIYRIQVIIFHAAAGLGNPVQVHRAINVSGGTLITASDVPKKDSSYPNASLEVRTGAVAGATSAQSLLIIGGTTVTGSGLGGPLDTWEADDILDSIILRGDEGILISQVTTADADDRYAITISWEEE